MQQNISTFYRLKSKFTGIGLSVISHKHQDTINYKLSYKSPMMMEQTTEGLWTVQ